MPAGHDTSSTITEQVTTKVAHLFATREEDPAVRVNVAATVGPSGVERLRYSAGDGPVVKFSGPQIDTFVGPDRVRATVVLDAGGETEPKITLEVVMPVVVIGSIDDDIPGEGPWATSAAALRVTHFPPTPGGPFPGPQQSLEALQLSGRAIAAHPGDDAF
jgi:hypothetical protein